MVHGTLLQVMITKLNIFDYVDYRLFLREYYDLQKKQTRYFSYRYFSNKAGFLSHNVLKQVIDGERNIASASIGKFCKALNFNSRECEYFKLMVLFNQTKNEQEKNKLFREMCKYKNGSRYKRINELQYQLYSEWYHAVIRELVSFVDIEEDVEHIARMINPSISSAQIWKSLKLLEELGLIEKDRNNKWVQKDPVLKIDPGVESLLIRNFHRTMIQLAEEAIESVPREKRQISTMTVNISQKTFALIKKKIQEFKDEIFSDVLNDSSPSEEVYQINFQLFPLLRTNWKEKCSYKE